MWIGARGVFVAQVAVILATLERAQVNEPLILSRALGAIIGQAAADNIGGPTAMALVLGRCLAKRGEFGPDQVFSAYQSWWQEDGRDSGATAAAVFRAVEAGTSREEAVHMVHKAQGGLSAGCNPAHRSAPLALAQFIPDDELANTARKDAELTHYDPIAGNMAAAHVFLLRQLIRGKTWKDALAGGKANADGDVAKWFRVPGRVDLQRGGYSPHVFGAAMFFVNSSRSAEEALRTSFEFAGAPNYCPVLVGALAGARWGADAIPGGLMPSMEVRETASRMVAELIGEN